MSNSENNATFSDEKAGNWKPLTDRELRRIALEQMEQVGVAWAIHAELYVRSALVRDYSPECTAGSLCARDFTTISFLPHTEESVRHLVL